MTTPPSDDARSTGPRRPLPIRKSLGQHFLNDVRVLRRIVDALELRGPETVIEIGPGRGSLSAQLLPNVGRLILIEYDRALAARLRERYASTSSVEIVEADVLEVDLGAVANGPYKLVGNVPYYITTPILFHAMTPPRPELAVYMVQREVADRIVAPPGSDAYGALSVNVQALATARSLFRVAPGAFVPPPKVESAVVQLTPRSDPVIAADEETRFKRFVIEAFGMRRKQLRRVIRTLFNLDAEAAEQLLAKVGIDPTVRPETLTPGQFAEIIRAR